MASRDEVQQLIDEISHLLGAPATLESRDFDLIAFCAHDPSGAEDLDSVRLQSILGRGSSAETRMWFESFGIIDAIGPIRTPPEPRLGILTRLCLPVRHGPVLLGYVWLLDDGRIEYGSDELSEARPITKRLAEVLIAHNEAADGLGDVLAVALSAPGPKQADAQRTLAAYLGGSPAVVVVGGASASGIAGVVETTIGTSMVRLVPLGDILDVGPALSVAEAGGRTDIGVGEPFGSIEALGESYRQARFALRVSGARRPKGRVCLWRDLGFERLLVDVRVDDPLVVDLISSLAAAPELLHTAEVFLDQAGNVQASAAELHIHRQTLYYRLTKVESITGLDFDSGTDRLLLHLVVKLAGLV